MTVNVYFDIPAYPSWNNGGAVCMFPFPVRVVHETGEDVSGRIFYWGDGTSTEVYADGSYLSQEHCYDSPDLEGIHSITVRVVAYKENPPPYAQAISIVEDTTITIPCKITGRYSYQQYSAVYHEITSQIPAYPFAGESTITHSAAVDTSSDDYGTVYYSDRKTRGWEWRIYHDQYGWQTIPRACSLGIISLISEQYSNTLSTIQYKPLIPGVYDVECCAKGYYYTHTSYSSNGIGSTTSYKYGDEFTVYEHAKVSIILVSSTDINAAPPYSVSVALANAAPHSPGISLVQWNFGDPSTGDANIAYSSAASHTYTGYGPYTIQLSIMNYAGETATATYVYSPNKTVRFIGDPTVDAENNTPGLVRARSVIAGYPTPSVSWTFVHEGGDYTGEKSGAEADISLILPGEYIVTVRATQGTEEVRREFTITLPGIQIYADTPVRMNDFDVWVLQDGVPVQYILPIETEYCDRYASPKYCTFSLPLDHSANGCIETGTEIVIGYHEKARLCIVEEVQEYEDRIFYTASDAASVALSSRVAIVGTRNSTDNGFDTQTYFAESLLRYFAISNLKMPHESAFNYRAIPEFRVVGEDHARGKIVSYSARYEPIMDIIEAICADSGLGWDTTLQESDEGIVWSFAIREGVDRSIDTTEGLDAVLFDNNQHGIHSAIVGKYTEYICPNVAVTAGKGERELRTFTDYGEIDASGIGRRECFADAGTSANDIELKRIGELELLRAKDHHITITPNQEVYKFGEDYDVGDYVSIRTLSGRILRMQIISAITTKNEGGTSITLECGTDRRRIQRLLREQELANTYARK